MARIAWKARIRKRWRAWGLGRSVAARRGYGARCVLVRVEPVLRNKRYSLWRLHLRTTGGQAHPVFLKILKSTRRNRVECNVYRRARRLIAPVLPQVYALRSHRGWMWIFQEQVEPLADRFSFSPESFARVMPAVARLHAAAFRPGPAVTPEPFRPWLPSYARGIYYKRDAYERTRRAIKRALRSTRLAALLRPHLPTLDILLKQGPAQFRELARTGWSVIHGDLHLHNICCNDLQAEPWDVRFIDWESARFAPVWFDLVVLVEMLIDFRQDWWPHEVQIRRRAVAEYLRAMERQGIRIAEKPWRPLGLAYLQRTLEIGLRTQLRRALQGRPAPLLPRYLEKLTRWSRALGLIGGAAVAGEDPLSARL